MCVKACFFKTDRADELCPAHARVFADPGVNQRSALADAQDLFTHVKSNGSDARVPPQRAIRTVSIPALTTTVPEAEQTEVTGDN